MSSDNWFKRKRYGIGWTPSSKKGWLSLALYLAIIIGLAVLLLRDVPEDTLTKEVAYFIGITIVITAIFIFSNSKKSPTSRWRWGKKDTDNPNEDL